MLFLLSPAKSLDLDSPLPTANHSQPRHLADAESLVEYLRELSVADLAALMKISDELAITTASYIAEWQAPFTPENSRPALFTFAGDVYRGLEAHRFSAADLDQAQASLRLLSGLYGVLRPLDLIQPYRLEMGTRLATDRGPNLYAWWGDAVTKTLEIDLANSPGAPVIVNLASKEYFQAVRPKVLDAPIITPQFLDTSAQGKRSIISFYAKYARGALAAWIIKNRVVDPEKLAEFAENGYHFDPHVSTPDRPVFVRPFASRPPVQRG